MFILKIIEWLGQEREKSDVSMWDADLLFVLALSALVGIIFIIDVLI
jgi:hypothetical protein